MRKGSWNIIDTQAAMPEENMAIDAKLLEEQKNRQDNTAILHLYEWIAPSATYGIFIDPFTYLNPEGVKAKRLHLAKRPTGGGIIFHVSDFAFSMIIPSLHIGYSDNILQNYAFVNAIVIEVISRFLGKKVNISLLPEDPIALHESASLFCMGKPTKYDVMIGGKKVGGGAQRKTRHAILHQGTISLVLPDVSFLESVLKSKDHVIGAMQANTYSLLNNLRHPKELAKARLSFKKIFQEYIQTS